MADTTKKMEKNQTAAVPQTHQFTEVESKYIYICIINYYYMYMISKNRGE